MNNMKRTILLVILLLFACRSASAVVSSKYLKYRRSDTTYTVNLYTSASDVGSHYIAARISGATYYAKLDTATRPDATHLRARVGGITYAAISCAYAYKAQGGSYGTGNAQLSGPQGIAANDSGSVYVCDTNNGYFKRFSQTGTHISTLGSGLTNPAGIAIDPSNANIIYVSDEGPDRMQKYDYGISGLPQVQWGGNGTADGKFSNPVGVAVDSSGNVYVCDTGNNRIQKFNSSGTFLAKWGRFGSGNGQFSSPKYIAIDTSDNIYVTDMLNNRVQIFNTSGTYQGQWSVTCPSGISCRDGYVFVAASTEDKVYKFTSSGTLVTSWGASGTGDGQFSSVQGIATDPYGQVFVVDMGYSPDVARFQVFQ